jgi:hypothetical protein
VLQPQAPTQVTNFGICVLFLALAEQMTVSSSLVLAAGTGSDTVSRRSSYSYSWQSCAARLSLFFLVVTG